MTGVRRCYQEWSLPTDRPDPTERRLAEDWFRKQLLWAETRTCHYQIPRPVWITRAGKLHVQLSTHRLIQTRLQ